MTLKRFTAELAKLGCTAEINRFRDGSYDVMVDAPEGKQFSGSELHTLVHHSMSAYTERERGEVRSEALEDAKAQLPLTACPPDCTCCEEMEVS
jgi:hypothetical protein